MKVFCHNYFFLKKNWVLENFVLILKPWKHFFVIGLEVLFSGDFASQSLDFFKSWSHGLNQGSHSLAKSRIDHSIPPDGRVHSSTFILKRIEFLCFRGEFNFSQGQVLNRNHIVFNHT